jgi:glycosyltransferase involved in cell wall biosynthesis
MIINWNGPVGPTGYGRFTRFLLPALEKLGHNMHLIPAYPHEMQQADPELAKYYNLAHEDMLHADANVKLSIANPSDAISMAGKRRILFNMLEVDKIPPYWVKSLNTMDEVWVPSYWGKKVYEDSGVIAPINVVPGGFDPAIFNEYREPVIPKNENFRFLFVGKWEYRKGVDLMLKAYTDEFKGNDKVEFMVCADSIRMFEPNFNIYKEMF